MLPRSAKAARIFGLIMILMVSAWDMDAMRPHIAAHSWYTLGFVALFLVVHLSDYLTVGQLVTRMDSLALVIADGMANAAHNAPSQAERIGQPTAKLYTFTAVTTVAAQASGAPYPISQQRFIVEPK